MRRLRRLLTKRATRWAEGAFVAEGPELLRSALDAGVVPESVFMGHGAAGRPDLDELRRRVLDAGSRVFDLAHGVLERVADTVTPQPTLAVLALPVPPPDALAGGWLTVVCTDVRDPGNAGTIIRSADAAGAAGVVVCGGTVDPFNPKTVRAAAGSVLHLPLVVEPSADAGLARAAAAGYRLLGAAATGGTPHDEVDWGRPTAVVLGNEAWGLAPEVAARLDGTVTVAMAGRAESLNVGVACAVLCFEALRQRRRGTGGGAPRSTMPGMPGGPR